MNAMREFITGYKVALLFAECDIDNAEGDDTSLESAGFSVDDFADETAATLRADAVSWVWQHRRLLRAAMAAGPGYSWERAGHDYYFTQAGHGVGFWDRGLGALGDALSDACNRRQFCASIDDAGRVTLN